ADSRGKRRDEEREEAGTGRGTRAEGSRETRGRSGGYGWREERREKATEGEGRPGRTRGNRRIGKKRRESAVQSRQREKKMTWEGGGGAEGNREGKVGERRREGGGQVQEARIRKIGKGKGRKSGRDAISLERTETVEEAAEMQWECQEEGGQEAAGAEGWLDTASWLGRLDRWRDRT
ncbi:hypothetical protein OIV53_31435, partial [Burkholderia pseudomallei]|nr:hypothetical protein [Burkholderia pseudomallei]